MAQIKLVKIEQVGSKGIRVNDTDLYLRAMSADIQNDHVRLYPERARNGDTYVGKIGEVEVNEDFPDTPDAILTALEFIGNFKSGGSDPALKERVAVLEGEMPGKADKIVTPHVDWNPDNFDLPAGRVLRFDTSRTPALSSATGSTRLAIYAVIKGDTGKLFGFFKDDGQYPGLTMAGLFHRGDSGEIIGDRLLYDGTAWVDGGRYTLDEDYSGAFSYNLGQASLGATFDIATGISVEDAPSMNLVDVYNELSGETSNLRDDVNAAFTLVNQEMATLSGKEDSTSSALVTETEARVSGDNDLQTQIDAMQGQTRRFFVDFEATFGTDTPTKAQTDAWLAAREPALTPNVGTAFKNNNTSQATYNHLFVYYTDPTDSNQLILSDDGVDTTSTASATSLGIVRGAGDVEVNLNGDMILKAGSVTDKKIGNRALVDEAGSSTLVPVAEKGLTAWLQGIRNNLKALFANKVDKTTAASKVYGTNESGEQVTLDKDTFVFEDELAAELKKRDYYRASKSGMAVAEQLYVACDSDALFAAYRSSGNNWRIYVSALDGSSIEVQSFVTLQYGTTATTIGQY
ncbi:MAG: hypothetical protein LBK12_08040, partial [Odoribacteraceae bacterium]|nr:hypothetical protein [Odoribacteraceae bacterium]